MPENTRSVHFVFIENSRNFIFISKDNILCDLFRGSGEY